MRPVTLAMPCRRVAFATFALLGLALPAIAQPAGDKSRIPTLTRLVKVFSELETTLNARIGAREMPALEQMLDPGFELRDAATPGTPVAHDDWVRRAVTAPVLDARVEQMAVHVFGTVTLVSFREITTAPLPGGAPKQRFIVDCWIRAGDSWKLTIRYVSDTPSPTAALPSPAPLPWKRETPSKPVEKRY